ncbi:MAG: enoyl-CoA hydratase-related protein [Alphaproteobacteria bacterium]
MEYKFLELAIDERGVARVTLNRPEIHNAFDDTLIDELTHAFKQLDADKTVRLAVLSGHGKSFCAGGDLNWMRKMKDYGREENIEDSSRLEGMFATLAGFSKPLISVVHGAAMGGGTGLAAVSDFVLASEDARFGFTEARLGIAPSVISPYVIEKVGVSYARAYFLSGMHFPSEVAHDMGLVHKVVARDDLHDAAEELIAEFLKAAPEAARKSKSLIRSIVNLSRDNTAREAIRQLTIETIADLRISEEGQEGMDALLSKRKPKWVA